MQLTVDDASWVLKAMLCAVSNGPTFGGGMRIAPSARPDDGLLDVCVVSEASRWELITTFPLVYGGRHTTHPKVRLVQGRRIRIETAHPVPLLVDGEIVGLTPAGITVVPGAIDVMAPIVSASRPSARP
jgi:diacylglycerol kinase (ATP)